jgi:hypothetical protein
MNDFLNSLKADLTDRRMLPLVGLAVAALVGALAYVALGGGSGSTAPAAAVPSNPVTPAGGLSVTQTTPEKGVAEVTSGAAAQKQGKARNPFTPLPEEKSKTSTSASSGSTASGTGSSGSAASGSGSGSTPSNSSPSSSGSSPSSSGSKTPSAPSTPSSSTPSTPSKHEQLYHVAVVFGVPASPTDPLVPYVDLKLMTPLPSAAQALVVYRGVTAGGKSATFTLVGEAILHGEGNCLPEAAQCEAIDLKPGQAEQLEYLPAGGTPVTYELKVVSIASSKASGAAVKDALRGESKAGRELLGRSGLLAIPYLHASSQVGVLVFDPHHAFGGGGHPAVGARHGR